MDGLLRTTKKGRWNYPHAPGVLQTVTISKLLQRFFDDIYTPTISRALVQVQALFEKLFRFLR